VVIVILFVRVSIWVELVVFESRGMDASVYMEKNGEAITKMPMHVSLMV
jgi:hypothetical protein